jgi:CheY-like chemotaxis protein
METMQTSGRDRAVRALRVVVVDPYAPGRDSLCACIEDLGHIVSGARDVHDAAQLLRQGLADLLLIDHSPPWTDGWHSLDALRCVRWVSAIVLSDDEPQANAAATSLRKPVSLAALERALARIPDAVA